MSDQMDDNSDKNTSDNKNAEENKTAGQIEQSAALDPYDDGESTRIVSSSVSAPSEVPQENQSGHAQSLSSEEEEVGEETIIHSSQLKPIQIDDDFDPEATIIHPGLHSDGSATPEPPSTPSQVSSPLAQSAEADEDGTVIQPAISTPVTNVSEADIGSEDETLFQPGAPLKPHTLADDAGDSTVIHPSASLQSKSSDDGLDATLIRSDSEQATDPSEVGSEDATIMHPSAALNLNSESSQSGDTSRRGIKTVNRAVTERGLKPVAPLKVIKDRFELLEVLGSGGMGTVYKAIDRRKVEAKDRNPYVAVKVLNDDFKNHPDAFISLQRESRKSQTLAHPNIVTVYDFDRDNDMVFMTMEFLEGEDLDKLIRKQNETSLELPLAFKILQGMADALVQAHKANVIHSDFKPGNVFVTKDGVAKVFDFGIARAVSQQGQGEDGEKTYFDPGSLGALTPNYASLEMLLGEAPDQRDDVFALACVAYQLFSGVHPYNRIPADQALEKNLKPKKLTNISSRQWKVIERGLALKRTDRTPSVATFIDEFNKTLPLRTLLVAAVAVVAVGIAVAQAFLFEAEVVDESEIRAVVQEEVEAEVKAETKAELQRSRLEEVLAATPFSGDWEQRLWREIEYARQILPSTDTWLAQQEQQVADIYVRHAKALRLQGNLTAAASLLQTAKDYQVAAHHLRTENEEVQAALLAEELRQQTALEEEQKRLQQAEQDRNFRIVLSRLRGQMACREPLNTQVFANRLGELKRIDAARSKQFRNEWVNGTAECVRTVAKNDPDLARKIQSFGNKKFSNDKRISKIVILDKDPCRTSLAGKGGKGRRYSCLDQIAGAPGPRLLVVPGIKGSNPYAIAQHEVSVEEFNQFCTQTGGCKIRSGSGDLPATQVSIQEALSYVQWLSEKTGYRYGLPTIAQWQHAATAQGGEPDSNRNCKLKAKGIIKGKTLLPTTTGKQNGWGLINHVGNVQEYAMDLEGGVYALGGSRTDAFSKCTVALKKKHKGKKDNVTGFRVVRQLRV